jgi:hypothetical protein
MAIVALKDVLSAFKTKNMPSQAAMEASVKIDLERLSQMQNGDGGYAYWERGYPSVPYLTVHVTNALVRAQKKGFAVPQRMIEQARPYLVNIEQHYPDFYGPEIRRTISSYALYTRKLMGDVDVAKAQKLIADAGGVTKLNMEANAWLLGTLVLSLLSVLVALQVFGLWSVVPTDTASDTLLLYALSSLNFIAFIVFAFIFVRSLLKLRRERRER